MKKTVFKRCFDSIYNEIIDHSVDCIRYDERYCTPYLKITIGKTLQINSLWVFDGNIQDDTFNAIQGLINKLYISCIEKKNANRLSITHTHHCQRLYKSNGWRNVSYYDSNVPEQYTVKQIDFLYDFLCNGRNLDLRLTCEQIKKDDKLNMPCIYEYDSIYEQHCNIYCFSNAIYVHFIVEFDITLDGNESKRYNRIEISFDETINFKNNFELKMLFDQILCMIVYRNIKGSDKSIYHLARKFSD